MKELKVDPSTSTFIDFALLFLLLLTCLVNGQSKIVNTKAEGKEQHSGEPFLSESVSCGGQTYSYFKVKGAYRYPPLLKLYTKVSDSGSQKSFHFSSRDQYQKKNSYGKVTILSLNSSSAEVTIECEAPYPIDLTFDGHLTNREFKVDIKRTSISGNTSCFLITGRSSTSERTTGNFTCFSVEEPKVGSSFYLYVTPPFTGYLLLRGQKLKVKVGVAEENVTLPCPTSNYLTTVQLWKRDERNPSQSAEMDKDDWTWTKIEPSKTVQYDPKIGWQLRVHPRVFGVYQCTTNGLDNVTIIVEDDGFQVYPAVVNVPLSINESFIANCTARNEVQFGFHGTKFQVEETINMDENSQSPKKPVRFSSIGIKTKPLKEYQITGSVTCQTNIKGTNVKTHTWNLEQRKPNQSEEPRLKPVQTSFFSEFGRNLDAIKVFECSNWIECRMRRCQQYDQNCRTMEFCVDDDNSVALGKCPKNVIYQYIPQYYSSSPKAVMMIYFSGLKTRQLNEWTAVPQDEILDLIEIESESKSNAVTFACHGSAFVFARLFHWTVTYRGETRNKTDIIQHISMENVSHSFSRSSMGIITSKIHLDNPHNIKEVSCTAPLWNSTGIKTITKSHTHNMSEHNMEPQEVPEKVRKRNGVSSSLNINEWAFMFLFLLNYLFFL